MAKLTTIQYIIVHTKIVTFYLCGPSVRNLNDSALSYIECLVPTYMYNVHQANRKNQFTGSNRKRTLPVVRKCWTDMAMFAGFTLQDKQFCYRKSKSGVCPARLQTMETFAYHLSTDLSLVHCNHVRSGRQIKSWKGEFCLSSLKMVNSLCYSVWVLSLVCFTDFNSASCSNQQWQPEREIWSSFLLQSPV